MTLKTPISLRLEHQELHDTLSKAKHEPGALGEAAALVARLLESHAHKEEQFAMPPLGLLADLARGHVDESMVPAVGLAAWLKAHLPDMLAEHRAIVAALERLMAAAREARRFEYADFAEKLIIHARIEEEVMYPAAIVVGEYVRLKLSVAEPA